MKAYLRKTGGIIWNMPRKQGHAHYLFPSRLGKGQPRCFSTIPIQMYPQGRG